MQVVEFPKKSTTERSSRRRVSSKSVTGRDGYIVCQALAYAIETIAALPDAYQELSNREDMLALLAASTRSDMAKLLRDGVCHHLFHEGSPLKRNITIDLDLD